MEGMYSGFGSPIDVPQAPKKAGMFGSGKPDWGGALQAAIYGALAARGNPAGMAGLQALQQRRQQALEEQQYQQHRSDSFEDWVKQQAYKAANPDPINNDTVNDYNFWQSKLSPEQFQEYVANKVNPPQFMNVPGVGLVQVPRMAAPQAPSAPVGKLTPIDGGPTPQASGGFQPNGY